MALRDDVLLFLQQIKQVLVQNQLNLYPRRKNRSDIAELGLTNDDVRDVILGLTPADYMAGPEADRNQSEGEVWIFGVRVNTDWVYIKLKLEMMMVAKTGKVVATAKCLSFHRALHPMSFPLRS